jgi:cation:H+ antiporter
VSYLSLIIGLLLLVTGAEMLVRGGGQLAMALRVPAMVVGLTVVAFGTSSPELIVCVTAALEASTDMALANVNGSNIANILLVLGLAALVAPLTVDRMLMRREVPTCLALQAMVPISCYDGVISRGDGLLLLSGGICYYAWVMYEALGGRRASMADDDEPPASGGALWVHGAMLVGGLGVLVIGANLFVAGAEEVALSLGMSQRFVGLTVVALGTSAPEVVTGMVSAYRGEVELAVGNSLGSNLLNISMVLGITALITPIVLTDPAANQDMMAALVATSLLIPIVLKGSISRVEGAALTGGYVVYVLALA